MARRIGHKSSDYTLKAGVTEMKVLCCRGLCLRRIAELAQGVEDIAQEIVGVRAEDEQAYRGRA